MRVAMRWLEQQRFHAARTEDDDLEELALYLAGADDVLAHRQVVRRLRLVGDAGGEVA